MSARITRRMFASLAAAMVLAIASVADAHHSFAMFDKNRLLTVSGVVGKVEWTNPHVFIYVDSPGRSGPVRYSMECGSISILTRAGWKISTAKVGDPIQVQYYPLKNGKPGGLLEQVKLKNGTVLKGLP